MPRSREPYLGTSTFGYFPPGVKWLLIVNTAIFVLCYLGGRAVQEPVTTLLAVSVNAAVFHLLVWQVFTYMFVHFGTMHLLFNMLGLWFFGVPIERAWGTRRFLKFYLLCGLVAGICVVMVNLIVGALSNPMSREMMWATPTLGASGAIFGVLVAFGVLYPEAIILMFFVFPMKAKYAVMIYVALELLATFGPNTGVSTIAHLGGAAFAYVYLTQGRLAPGRVRLRLPDIRGAYDQWKLQRAKRKFQVYMRKHGRGRGPWVN
jgi:membrane associated rhomboid family serine protease